MHCNYIPAVKVDACDATKRLSKRSGYILMAESTPASSSPSTNWSSSALTFRMVLWRAALRIRCGTSVTDIRARGLVSPQSSNTSHASPAIRRTSASSTASVSYNYYTWKCTLSIKQNTLTKPKLYKAYLLSV